MSTTHLHWTDTFDPADPYERAALQRLSVLAQLLDSAFEVPGTKVRLGLDAMIGLVPGIGDAISAALGSYLVYEARQLGAPNHLVARMAGNVMLDFALGAVPVLGDAADVLFRANKRNMALLQRHLERKARRRTIDGTATRL
ncbi:DUF4112 domain-containing protein [Blastochloris viridis]|uniref:DUF4112 domain-containing protein n=1 Tax=Blastochloris viridis TaxID=1079 RepID=A0A0H5BKA8_BLAVI|nr:DUF4112 domain-containing protein [Blastochloris viridis]ALK09056.1 hypothetical protein BVIR_1269 [Blastochloris viridis]BAS01082.1 hypothetical protein BV133_3488 [Blastochloris viridis]CUU41718.1 hypothetical protein BVIRIDIS_07130 [Blastochloris viridis]